MEPGGVKALARSNRVTQTSLNALVAQFMVEAALSKGVQYGFESRRGYQNNAQVVELAVTADLESAAARRTGSNPVLGTT